MKSCVSLFDVLPIVVCLACNIALLDFSQCHWGIGIILLLLLPVVGHVLSWGPISSEDSVLFSSFGADFFVLCACTLQLLSSTMLLYFIQLSSKMSVDTDAQILGTPPHSTSCRVAALVSFP